LVDYALDLKKAERSFRQRISDWAFLDPTDEQVRYLTAIQDANWDGLLGAGRVERKARDNSLSAIAPQESALAALWSRRSLATKAARRLTAPSDRDDYAALRDQLEARLASEGMSASEIGDLLGTLDALAPADIPKAIDSGLRRMIDRLQHTISRHEGAAMGAVLAMSVARFNQAVASPPDLADAPEAYVSVVLPDLDARERELWRTIRAQDPFITLGVARDLQEVAGRRLLVGAIPHAASLAKQRAVAPADAQLGAQALKIGTLIRRLLRGLALSMALESACHLPVDAPPFREWVRLAERAVRPGSAWRWPRHITPATLANSATQSEGKARTVAGRVTAVTIRHRGRKAISVVTIEQDGVSIDAVLSYIKADSGGMVPGAWCRVAGTWRNNSSEAGGPALELDRLALGDLARVGWHEAITVGVSPIFTPVPHGLAAEWSWEPGTDGAGNQLRYGTWLSGRGG
jgi:hypothetical protein